MVVRRRRPVPFGRTSQTSLVPRDGERAKAIHLTRYPYEKDLLYLEWMNDDLTGSQDEAKDL